MAYGIRQQNENTDFVNTKLPAQQELSGRLFCALYQRKFIILEFQLIAYVHAEGEQGDGNFGNDAGVVVLDIGIVAADIYNGAEHKILL